MNKLNNKINNKINNKLFNNKIYKYQQNNLRINKIQILNNINHLVQVIPHSINKLNKILF